jgi:uncharacterized protein with HEPN domain
MRDVGIVLVDNLDAIDAVREVTSTVSFQDFSNNRLSRLAAERAIEIISEAVRHLPDDLLERHPDIPWTKIKAIGNNLRHEYHRVAPKIVWDSATYELDSLERALKAEQSRWVDPLSGNSS